jgi:hypothetical protein
MPRRPQGQQQSAVTTRHKMRSAKAQRAAPEQAEVRIVLDPNETAPVFYVNYMEAANTANDFSLLCSRMPAKLSDERKRQVLATKELHVEPDVVITFPTSLVPGLIRALTTQKENYEKAVGATIQEPGVTK